MQAQKESGIKVPYLRQEQEESELERRESVKSMDSGQTKIRSG